MGNKATTSLVEGLQNPEDEARLRALYNSFDKDGNGLLNKQELVELSKKIVKQKRKLKLDKLALENHPVIFTNTLFTLMDQDGDGNVSFEEFKLFWTKMKLPPQASDVSYQVGCFATLKDIQLALVLGGPSSVDQRDNRAQTPLFHAVRHDYYDAAKLLLGHGAEVNAEESHDQKTAIFYVKSLAMTKLLVENGAKLDGVTLNHNNSLLHHLLIGNELNVEVLNYLIDVGAPTTHKNTYGQTLTDFIQQNNIEVPGFKLTI